MFVQKIPTFNIDEIDYGRACHSGGDIHSRLLFKLHNEKYGIVEFMSDCYYSKLAPHFLFSPLFLFIPFSAIYFLIQFNS